MKKKPPIYLEMEKCDMEVQRLMTEYYTEKDEEEKIKIKKQLDEMIDYSRKIIKKAMGI
jgi:hypothetical protein